MVKDKFFLFINNDKLGSVSINLLMVELMSLSWDIQITKY